MSYLVLFVCLFRYMLILKSSYLFWGFGGFLLWSFISRSYILNINPLSNVICKYFLPFSRLPFHFVDYFLCHVEDFSLMHSDLFIFACVGCAFSVISENLLSRTMLERPWIYFELIFCVLCKKRVRYILWSMVFSFHNIIFLRIFFSILYSWHPVAD